MKDLIKTINVNKANFEHIAETGVINGTLLTEIERILDEYSQELKRHKWNLQKGNETLRQRLVEAGLEVPAVIIDYQRNS